MGKTIYLSMALFYTNGSQNSDVFTPYLCIYCTYQRVQSLQTFSPPVIILLGSTWCCTNTRWESLFPKQNVEWPETDAQRSQRSGIHTRAVSHWLSGSMAEDKSKPLAKSVCYHSLIYTGWHKESSFLICLFYFVHSLSKPFLALVVQTEIYTGPKHSSAFASALYQHCHGYIIIPTSAS